MKTKFFVGTRLTPDLKGEWNGIQQGSFQQILHEGKEYLGLYLSSSSPTLGEIRTTVDHFATSLQKCCPELRVDKLSILIFPQLFVG